MNKLLWSVGTMSKGDMPYGSVVRSHDGSFVAEVKEGYDHDAVCALAKTHNLQIEELQEQVRVLRAQIEKALGWVEVAHRPPVRDEFECGRMVHIRLHALADLHSALTATAPNN